MFNGTKKIIIGALIAGTGTSISNLPDSGNKMLDTFKDVGGNLTLAAGCFFAIKGRIQRNSEEVTAKLDEVTRQMKSEREVQNKNFGPSV